MAEAGGVVILTHRHPLQYLIVNELVKRFAVRQIIYERPSAGHGLRLMARRARRVGLGTVLAQLAYIGWDRAVVRPQSAGAIAQLLAGRNLEPPGEAVPQIEVDSINAEAVAERLEAIRPRVGVVLGTSILRPHILQKAPVFLNLHAGITPRYRGAHGAFWAVWEGRPELAGVTVHLVDAGIDTGGIVAQATIALSPSDTPRTLVAKQALAGLPLMVEAVAQALAGAPPTRQRSDLESRLWQTPTPLSYLKFRRQLTRLAREGKLTANGQQSAT